MKKIKMAGSYVFLTLISLISVFPFYYTICMASGGNTDIAKGLILPGKELWNNIRHIVFETQFMNSFLYTLGYTAIHTFLTLCVCATAGYGFEVYHTKGKDQVFKVILLTYMIPFTTLLIPTFIMFSKLHLVNTTVAIFLPFIASPLVIMLYRQNSRAFPRELMEAAQIDGLQEPWIFLRIYLPNMRSTLACSILITFFQAWNSSQWARVIMMRKETIPMTVYLGLSAKGNLMTLVLLSMFPSLILLLFLQKYFMKGLQSSM